MNPTGTKPHDFEPRLTTTARWRRAPFPVWSDDEFRGHLRGAKRPLTGNPLRRERFADLMVDSGRKVTAIR